MRNLVCVNALQADIITRFQISAANADWPDKGLILRPERMRLREMGYNNTPKALLFDDAVAMPLSYQKKFCVELLPVDEMKTDAKQLLVYFRQFHRDTLGLPHITHVIDSETDCNWARWWSSPPMRGAISFHCWNK